MIAWLISLGVSEKWARPLLVALAVILLVTSSVVLKSCYDKGVVEKHEQKATIEVLEKSGKANEKAAERRAEDTIKNKERHEKRIEAIESASDGPPSDAAIALGCERLRLEGYDTSRIPACSGR